MANISSNVIYVEPNYATSYKDGYVSYNQNGESEIIDGISTFEMAPPLEDYCVAFQLTVVKFAAKTTSNIQQDNKVIQLKVTNSGGNQTISLLQGTTMPGGLVNYLTTAALSTSLIDIREESSAEMFGVKSIDISYNAYMTPEVVIKFTDIRAATLFTQEELNHAHNGMASNEDVAASFFHCFFEIPYPLFGLTVKGFYGEAVSYELMVQGFNFKIDPSTGNYEAEAKFLGYTWSILADVTFNVVVAAPYCTYNGMHYWDTQVKNGVFISEEGTPLPKLAEIINNYKNLKEKDEKTSQFDPVVTNAQKHMEELSVVQNAQNLMKTALETLKNGMGKNTSDPCLVINDKSDWSDGVIIAAVNKGNSDYLTSNDNIISFFSQIQAIYDYNSQNNLLQFKSSIKDFTVSANEMIKPENYSFDNKYYIKKIDADNNSNANFNWTTETNAFDGITFNSIITKFRKDKKFNACWEPLNKDDKIYLFVINLIAWNKYITEKISLLTTKTEQEEKEISQQRQLDVAKAIGINPTLFNLTKVMIAHLETFFHCLGKCEENISENRTYASTKLNETNIVTKCDKAVSSTMTQEDAEIALTPFPEVKIKTINNEGNGVTEDGWLGDLSDSDELEEVKLVESMLIAIDKLQSVVESTGSTFTNVDGTTSSVVVGVPVVPSDAFITEPIWDIQFFPQENGIPYISGAIALRGAYVYRCMADTSKVDNRGIVGKLDAYNLYRQDVNGISQEWCSFVKQGKENFVNTILNIISGGTTTYTNYPWHQQNGDGTNSQTALFDINAKPNYPTNAKMFPIQNISFELQGLGKEGLVATDTEKIFASYDENKNDVKGNTLFRFFSDAIDFSGIGNIYDTDDYVKDIDGSNKIGDNFKVLQKVAVFDRDTYGELFGKDHVTSSDFRHDGFMEKFGNISSWTPITTKYTKDESKLSFTFAEDTATMIDSNYGTAFKTKGVVSDFLDRCREGVLWTNELLYFYGYDGNNMQKATRDADHNLGHFLKEPGNDITKFTIPRIMGVNEDGKQDPNMSIFTQEVYVGSDGEGNSTSTIEKAILFLLSLTNGQYGLNIDDCNTKFREQDNSGKGMFAALPYLYILLLGAYVFWNKYQGEEEGTYFRKGQSASNKKLKKSRVSEVFGNENKLGNKLKFIVNARYELTSFLHNEFTNWVNGKESQIPLKHQFTFKEIRSEFEVTNNIKTIQQIAKTLSGKYSDGLGSKYKTFEQKLIEGWQITNHCPNFFKNYVSMNKAGDSNLEKHTFILILRESSPAVDRLTAFFVQPVVFVKFNEWLKITEGEDRIGLGSIGSLKTYLEGFYDEYSKLMGFTENTTGNARDIEMADVSKHIKISLYKYIKIVYDKWLSAKYFKDNNGSNVSAATHWGIENFFNHHFHFIDPYYMDCKDIYFDMEGMANDFNASFTQESYSFSSFLSNSLNKTQCVFYPIQNFLDYYRSEDAEKMMNLFKPLPYNEAFGKITGPESTYPDFVIMYKHEESSEPASEDDCGDSFMLNEDEQFLPLPIRSRVPKEKGRIPAFGVSYGKQYQSYFHSIDVSTDAPMPTEQATKAQYVIGLAHSEDSKQIQPLSQDLYSVYSKQSYTCTVQMMGDMWIQPTMYFVLTNVPTFRGSYMIQKVNHQITPGKMTTTFVGTRQASTSVPHVYNWYAGISKEDANGDGSATVDSSRRANLDNDCPYKVFTPGAVGGSGAWTEEMLNCTVDEFLSTYDTLGLNAKIQKRTGKPDRDFPMYTQCHNQKVIDMFAYIMCREVGGQDNLASYIVATTKFNAFTNKDSRSTPGSLKNIFIRWGYTDDMHKFDDIYNSHKSKWEIPTRIIREIFTQTPAILIGKTVNQGDKSSLYNRWKKEGDKYVKTAYKPQAQLETVVTSRGDSFVLDFDTISVLNRQGDAGDHVGSYNTKWTSFFCCDVPPNGNQLVGGDEDAVCMWSLEPDNSQNDKTVIDKLKDLVESIQKTCSYSESINITNIYSEYKETSDGGYVKISVIESMDNPSQDNAILFDIALNAYKDYNNYTYWVVSDVNNCSQLPIYVVIGNYNDDSHTPKRAVVYADGDNYTAITDNVTSESGSTAQGILNDYFYRSMAKQYINTSGGNTQKLENLSDTIINEAVNFDFASKTETDNSMKEYGNIVFNLLQQFAPFPCISPTQSSTWDGPTIDGLPFKTGYFWIDEQSRSNGYLPPTD